MAGAIIPLRSSNAKARAFLSKIYAIMKVLHCPPWLKKSLKIYLWDCSRMVRFDEFLPQRIAVLEENFVISMNDYI